MAENASNPPVVPTTPPEERPKAPVDYKKGADGKFASVRESLGLKSKGEKKPETPPETPPVVPAPRKKKDKPAPAPEPTNIIELATAVGESVARAIKPAAPVVPTEEDEVKLLAADLQSKYRVLSRMAKNDPALAEIPKQFLSSLKKFESYKAEWLAANKGKEFNREDDEHQEFLQSNDVAWDEDKYVEALADMRAEGAIEKVEKKFDARVSEVEKREKAAKARPLVINHAKATAKVFFGQLGDDFKEVLDAGGNYQPAKYKELVDKNPIYEDLLPFAQHTEDVASEIYRLANGFSDFGKPSPDLSEEDQKKQFRLHHEIMPFILGEERRLKEQPADKQLNAEGKMFATGEEWEKLSPEQRAKHWTFNDKLLSALFAFNQAKEAKKIIKKATDLLEKTIKARGLQPSHTGNGASAEFVERVKNIVVPMEKPRNNDTPAGIVAPKLPPQINRSPGEKSSVRAKLLGR
jgi:hypothetical protein